MLENMRLLGKETGRFKNANCAKIISAVLCLVVLSASPLYASPREKLKVGYLPILDHLTLIVSHSADNESFTDVDVEPMIFKRWNDMVGAFNAGVIDAAFILSPLAMDMSNSGTGLKTVLLAHRNGSAITVAKNSGIHSAADLAGKTVAIPHEKATHVALLDSYLRRSGLSLRDVNISVVAPPDMEKAMLTGKLDAFIVAEPFGAKAHIDGVGETLVFTKDIVANHVECIVVVRTSFIERHPSAVQEWVDSLLRAGRFIEAEKGKGVTDTLMQIIGKYMGHDEIVVKEALMNPKDRITFSNLEPRENDFRKIADISIKAGIIQRIRLDAFIDGRFYKNRRGK